MHVVVGLGGNVGSVDRAFREAVSRLSSVPGVSVEKRSTVLSTKPVGPPQRPYLNAAILIRTQLAPVTMLDVCQDVERRAGRNRKNEIRWGPRPLDLDLLIADGIVCRGPRVVLPHPRLCDRAFALIPAAELAPDWIHPFSADMLHALAMALPVDGSWADLETFAW